MWSNSLVSGKQRSTDALCKESSRITNLMFSFTLPVFVLLRLFLEKMTQCINKYIHKYAKHLLWRKRKKKSGDSKFRQKKSLMDVCGISQSTHRRGSDGRQRLIPGWLSCHSAKMRKDGSFLLKDYDLKEEYVHCASKKSGGLRFHIMWTQRREYPQSAEGVSKVIIREPCTQNYLITVHMFIYSTTTSICAFWTVTKWCFIACCIDNANYNCSSTILE